MTTPRGARLAVLAVALATAVVSPAIHAQTPTPPRSLADSLTGEARRDYDAALVLHDIGDFAGAVRNFRSAYQASNDVRLLWNEAACEQAMRHYAKAIVLMRRYLASGSPLITPETEQSARAFIDAALPLTVRLVVDATPAGASVRLNGELVGTTPLDPDVRVDFGTHQLVVTKTGLIEESKSLAVTSPSDVHVKVSLEPKLRRGRLLVRAGKRDSISLDGRFVGVGTYDDAVESGRHVLRVTAPGSHPFEARVTVEDDRTRAIDVLLQPEPVSARIPTWLWIAGGSLLAAGAGVAGYFALRTSDDESRALPPGSAAEVRLPLR
jgi:hypothetical protein